MLNLSVCAIVKNEEKRIAKFLSSLSAFDCEILILDTGSSDKTVEIASNYPCRIEHFKWINDFSAARNHAASLATNDWILFIDCDEYVWESDLNSCVSLMNEHPYEIGLLERVNLFYPDTLNGSYIDRVPRLYNRNHFMYQGKIHEQVVSKHSKSLQGFYIPLRVLHDGYIGSPAELENKHIRNITMLKESLEEDSNNRYYNFQLGQEYYNLHEYNTAIPFLEKAIDQDLSPCLEYHRLSLMHYSDCLINTNQISLALNVLNKYEQSFSNCADYFYIHGLAYYLSGDLLHAMQKFIEAISTNIYHKDGTNTYMPYHYLGKINELYGNQQQADFFFSKQHEYEDADSKRIAELQ